MKALIKITILLVFFSLPCAGELSAKKAAPQEVVVYTGVDQVFSEPILKKFETLYNIKVKAVYDIEAVKTTGLVNRLIAEKRRPHCDVFWNSEIVRTIQLKRRGILTSYLSPSAVNILTQYRDPEGFWTGFAARARVFVINTDLLKENEYPLAINDLSMPSWSGKVALANPLFGTTASHMAAIFASRSDEKARSLLQRLQKNNIQIVDGNSVVRDMVGSGEILLGLSDSDDVAMGRLSGLPIKAVLPRQNNDALLIPGTVSLISGCPHPEAARKLIDYLLSVEVEQQLINSGFALVSLRKNPARQLEQARIKDLVEHHHNYDKLADNMDVSMRAAQQIFIQ